MQGFHKEQVQDAVETLGKYVHQAVSVNEKTIHPKGTKLSHLHIILQNAIRMEIFKTRHVRQPPNPAMEHRIQLEGHLGRKIMAREPKYGKRNRLLEPFRAGPQILDIRKNVQAQAKD